MQWSKCEGVGFVLLERLTEGREQTAVSDVQSLLLLEVFKTAESARSTRTVNVAPPAHDKLVSAIYPSARIPSHSLPLCCVWHTTPTNGSICGKSCAAKFPSKYRQFHNLHPKQECCAWALRSPSSMPSGVLPRRHLCAITHPAHMQHTSEHASQLFSKNQSQGL
jgi:hypothetical protein